MTMVLPERARPRRGNAAWRRILALFLSQPIAVVAMAILVAMTLLAIFEPVLPLGDPNAIALRHRFEPMSWAFPLGTDDLGRGQLSRAIVGIQTSLLAACQATLVALVLGVPLGLCAAYFGGLLDTALGRISDALQSIPPLILAMAIVAAMGSSLTSAMIAIGVVLAPRIFRLVRGATLSVVQSGYIEAAQSFGARNYHIILRHVLPNVMSPLMIQISMAMSAGVLSEAALSFLGLGVQPPDASLGNMLTSAAHYMYDRPDLMFIPGLLIIMMSVSFSVVADALRDAMEASR